MSSVVSNPAYKGVASAGQLKAKTNTNHGSEK